MPQVEGSRGSTKTDDPSLITTTSSRGRVRARVGIQAGDHPPKLPVAIAQARYDQDVDRLVGSANAFLCRGIVGYVLSGALASIPLRSDGGLIFVCFPAVVIGAAGAILQGILYQMASFVSANCAASTQSLKASVAAGIQASALVALLVSVGTGFGSSADDTVDDLRRFNAVICLLETCMLGLFVFLMIRSRRISHAMVQRDSSISLANDFHQSGDSLSVNGPEPPDETPLLQGAEIEDDECSGNSDPYEEEDPDRPPVPQTAELTYHQIWKYSSRCFTSLLLTLAPSFLVASWFTKVNTEVMMLPQILFYVRIISDFTWVSCYWYVSASALGTSGSIPRTEYGEAGRGSQSWLRSVGIAGTLCKFISVRVGFIILNLVALRCAWTNTLPLKLCLFSA